MPSLRQSRAETWIISTSTSGPGVPEGLAVDLVELAVAPLLRPLVAEHRPASPQPLLLVVQQPVLDGRAHQPGGRLGPQAQAVAAAVVEGVHLLLDDVGVLADRALEELRALDERHAASRGSRSRQTARARPPRPAASTAAGPRAGRSFRGWPGACVPSVRSFASTTEAATAPATATAAATSHGQRARGRAFGRTIQRRAGRSAQAGRRRRIRP